MPFEQKVSHKPQRVGASKNSMAAEASHGRRTAETENLVRKTAAAGRKRPVSTDSDGQASRVSGQTDTTRNDAACDNLESVCIGEAEHDVALVSTVVQTELTMSCVAQMENSIESHYTQMYCNSTKTSADNANEFHISKFSDDNERVKYYTGLENFHLLMIVFNFVEEHVNSCTSLSKFHEFILVLMRLRLNAGLQDLAFRSNISISTVSRVIIKWIVVLDIRLSAACLIWPDRENLCKTMPTCFKQAFGNKVVVIIDCFEIFIDRPSNVLARAETWSQYKHHNTVKFLIGIAPQGVVSFLSSGWGGRVSDKYLTEHCRLLDKLLPGDVVLADRGFTVGESVSLTGATLAMPAFTKGRDQLTALEVEQSRAISNVRIHVERVIGTVRQKYTILGGPLPVDFLIRRSSDDVPLIDRLVRVCCCLTNLCTSVVPS